ncbi:hypothetical protein [Brevundimonas sp.]|uniref:hypothetical protein n=1 Tax=Brevundimonas sp. TaxID=1871086 RepID=UPI00289E3433|nr:hypothetical protein [Brevundimonas sp.]
MTTERRVEHPDGTVEHITTESPNTIVTEKRGGGMGFIGVLIALIAIGVISYFAFTMTQTRQVKDNAVADAAARVGNTADKVGEAVDRVVPEARPSPEPQASAPS